MPNQNIIIITGATPTPTPTNGSLILNFDELVNDRGVDFINCRVNGLFRNIRYTDTEGLYTTNINLGDVVSMQVFTSPSNLGKQISLTRRDYTTDDQNGDNGIRDTFITSSGGTSNPVSIIFTATTVSDAYNFEYRVTASTFNPGPTPTPTPTPTPLPEGKFVLVDIPTVFPPSFSYDERIMYSSTGGGNNTYSSIYQPIQYPTTAGVSALGNVVSFAADKYYISVNSGITFTTGSFAGGTTDYEWSKMDINYTGEYQAIGKISSGSLFVSSNYGFNFNPVSGSTKNWQQVVVPNVTYPMYGITSTLNDYIYKVDSLSSLTNLGNNSRAPIYIDADTGLTGATSYSRVAVSKNNQYILASYNTLSTLDPKDGSVLLSTNSGSTFSFVYLDLLNNGQVAMSETGQYMFVGANTTNSPTPTGWFKRSTDYGATWSTGSTIGNNRVVDISASATGQYVFVTIQNQSEQYQLKKSSDYGATFSDIIVDYIIGSWPNGFEFVKQNKNNGYSLPVPTPPPTSTPTPTPTGTPTPTPTPTGTPTPTPTATPTSTPTPTPTPVIPSNLVLNLDAGDPLSYPGTGTTWYDLSGSGHTTTLVNGPTYSSLNGGSIVFDGVNDYANILRTGLTIGSNFTWNMWFKTNKITDNQRIFGNWSSNGSSPLFNFIFVWQINSGKIDGGMRNISAVDILPSYTGATISASTIYNLAITWEASTKTTKIYLNGSLNQTLVSVLSNVNIGVPTDTNMTLAQSDGGNYLDGNIYNIQAYSKTLTSTEVSDLYSYYVTRYS